MQALIKVFVERACSFLRSQVSHLGDAVLSGLSKSQHTGSWGLPDHRLIRQRLTLLRPLMQVNAHVLPGCALLPLLLAVLICMVNAQLTLCEDCSQVCVTHGAISNSSRSAVAHKKLRLSLHYLAAWSCEYPRQPTSQ